MCVIRICVFLNVYDIWHLYTHIYIYIFANYIPSMYVYVYILLTFMYIQHYCNCNVNCRFSLYIIYTRYAYHAQELGNHIPIRGKTIFGNGTAENSRHLLVMIYPGGTIYMYTFMYIYIYIHIYTYHILPIGPIVKGSENSILSVAVFLPSTIRMPYHRRNPKQQLHPYHLKEYLLHAKDRMQCNWRVCF